MKTIRIGITGHRILARDKSKEIETGVLKALSKIAHTFPSHTFTIVSALAEGADCFFVERALTHLKAELLVVLPMHKAKYLESFTSIRAKKTFATLLQKSVGVPILIPEQDTSEAAYLKAGEYIIENCDVLVAIWDGKSAQGVGGTGQIVEIARRNGRPLIWILAGNRQPGTHIPTHHGNKEGIIRVERFPEEAR